MSTQPKFFFTTTDKVLVSISERHIHLFSRYKDMMDTAKEFGGEIPIGKQDSPIQLTFVNAEYFSFVTEFAEEYAKNPIEEYVERDFGEKEIAKLKIEEAKKQDKMEIEEKKEKTLVEIDEEEEEKANAEWSNSILSKSRYQLSTWEREKLNAFGFSKIVPQLFHVLEELSFKRMQAATVFYLNKLVEGLPTLKAAKLLQSPLPSNYNIDEKVMSKVFRFHNHHVTNKIKNERYEKGTDNFPEWDKEFFSEEPVDENLKNLYVAACLLKYTLLKTITRHAFISLKKENGEKKIQKVDEYLQTLTPNNIDPTIEDDDVFDRVCVLAKIYSERKLGDFADYDGSDIPLEADPVSEKKTEEINDKMEEN